MKLCTCILALATSASAQVFDWGFNSQLSGIPAQFDGQITINAAQNTAAIDGNFSTSGPSDLTFGLSETRIIPGTFPAVRTVVATAEITLHVPTVSIDFSNPPAVPTPAGGYIFSTPYTGGSFQINVGYSYTLREDGVEFASGSGSYSVAGKPTQLFIDVEDYPTSAAVGLNSFWLAAPSNVFLFSETSPNGITLSKGAYPLGVGLALVPEPSAVAFAFGLGLIAFGILRRTK